MILNKSDENSVKECVSYLKQSKILIIPTDTVYGFSGIAVPGKQEDTDFKIKKIKGREQTKPFIQLIASPEALKSYTDDKIPSDLLSYWPGPLTIIVNNKQTGTTTAFRCPGDAWLRNILKELDCPVYSTSVNRSGFPILDSESEIINEFEKDVDLIITDGDKKNALPSTIVSVCDGELKVLRQGAVELKL